MFIHLKIRTGTILINIDSISAILKESNCKPQIILNNSLIYEIYDCTIGEIYARIKNV